MHSNRTASAPLLALSLFAAGAVALASPGRVFILDGTESYLARELHPGARRRAVHRRAEGREDVAGGALERPPGPSIARGCPSIRPAASREYCWQARPTVGV